MNIIFLFFTTLKVTLAIEFTDLTFCRNQSEISKFDINRNNPNIIKLFYLKNSNSLSSLCTLFGLFHQGIDIQIYSSVYEKSKKLNKNQRLYYKIGENGEIKKVKLFRKRKWNLNGKEMRVGALPWTMSFVITMDGDNVIPVGGVDYNLLKVFADKLNFTYRLLIPEDRQWGVKKKNGEWTGLIRMIQKKEADFAMNFLSVTKDRREVVNFTIPYITETVTFAVHSPYEKSKALAVIRPFPLQLWIGIFFAYLIVGFIIYVLNHLVRDLSVSKIYWFMFETLMLKGDSCYFQQTRIRLVIISWTLSVVVLTASYSGLLISFMTVPGYYNSVNSIDDLKKLVQEKRLECGSIPGTAEYANFMNSKSEVMQIIAKSLIKPGNSIHSVEKLLEKTLEEEFALIMIRLSLKAYISKFGDWKFHLSTDNFYSVSNAIALRENFPFREQFNDIISKSLQAGLITKWIGDRLSEIKRSAPKKQEENIQHLRMDDVQATFYILIIGYLLSTAALIGELICKYFRIKSLE